MKRRLLLLPIMVAAIFGLSSGGTAYAHHSFAATYFVDKSITIEGTLREFMFRNPHSFVKVDAVDEKGNMVTWSVEWGGGAQLAAAGITRDSLRAGDHVIITGNPGRDPEEHRIRMQSIKRPTDSFEWKGNVE